MVASQSGDVHGITSSGVNMHLEKVLYLPQLSENLLSISKMADRGYTTIFTAGSVMITHKSVRLDRNKVILWGECKHNLYPQAGVSTGRV